METTTETITTSIIKVPINGPLLVDFFRRSRAFRCSLAPQQKKAPPAQKKNRKEAVTTFNLGLVSPHHSMRDPGALTTASPGGRHPVCYGAGASVPGPITPEPRSLVHGSGRLGV
eukprot:EG_transcript_42486